MATKAPKVQIPADVQDWLLDPADPGPRYLSQLHLFPTSEAELDSSKEQAFQAGPIRQVLENMAPEGYWEKAGPGYLPKYRSGVWSLILLAQLGATAADDARISTACTYYLDQGMTEAGQFTIRGTPSTNVDCLQGNMLAALLDLGHQDPRIQQAFEWMAQSVTGDGVSPVTEKGAPLRYYSGNIGPLFRCGANYKEPCAGEGPKPC